MISTADEKPGAQQEGLDWRSHVQGLVCVHVGQCQVALRGVQADLAGQ
jgi:hypothetical protein